MQNLSVISVNLWSVIISIINLFLLFLILKKFLYKPVRNFVKKRDEEVNSQLTSAKEARREAEEEKDMWYEKMQIANIKSEEIIKQASDTAKLRGEEIINEARSKAGDIISTAKTQAELEQRKAESEIREQIVVLSNELTEKILEREVNENDNRDIINSFLEEVGNRNG